MKVGISYRRDRYGERGVAMFVALILISILTMLAFGLIVRSLYASRIAGLERWSAKTFYAADSGVAAARVRLRIQQTGAFELVVADRRGPNARPTGTPIRVNTGALRLVGPPRQELGSQVGGGQGGGAEPLGLLFYRTHVEARHALSKNHRELSAVMSIGPVPLSEPQDPHR
ncbi:MAG: hypothetical protein K8R59_13280 [Thermoanaerobaculales bacterium]|nr:hypothetical protein [Thermoanaerobaculales bacterium]